MARHFDNELRDLKFGLLAMAGQVEEMISLTRETLLERSNPKAETVSQLDLRVDEFELRLDQACIDLLALRAPFASDLRLIASTLKIVPELERIGDHCCNIARRALTLNPQPPIDLGDSLHRLGAETHSMVRRAVDAFVNGDAVMPNSASMAGLSRLNSSRSPPPATDMTVPPDCTQAASFAAALRLK